MRKKRNGRRAVITLQCAVHALYGYRSYASDSTASETLTVIDASHDANDSFLEQPRVNVIRSFPASSLFDDHRDERHRSLCRRREIAAVRRANSRGRLIRYRCRCRCGGAGKSPLQRYSEGPESHHLEQESFIDYN